MARTAAELLAEIKKNVGMASQKYTGDTHQIELNLKEPGSTKLLTAEMIKTRTSFKGWLGEILTAIRAIKLQAPKVEVTVPDQMEVKKPSWLKDIFDSSAIEDKLDEIKEKLGQEKEDKALEWPKEAKEAIPVRLSDGDKFINQLQQVITQGGGTSIPKVASTVAATRNVIAVPVVNPDGSNISGSSGGGTGDASAANQTTEIARLDTIITHVDGIETLITSTNTKLDTVNTNLGTVDGHVDGIETLITSTNSKIDTINTNLSTIDGHVDQIEGYVDGIETLITSTNTKLDTVITSVQLIDDIVHSGDVAIAKYAAIGAVFDDVASGTVTENQAQSLRMSSRRSLYIEQIDAHDDASTVKPVRIAGRYTSSPAKVSASGDTVDLALTQEGKLLDVHSTVAADTTNINSNYAAAQTNTSLVSAPGANKRLVLVEVIYSCDTAGNMKFVEDPAGTPATKFGPHYFPANGGMVATKCYIPLTANKAFGITTINSGNHTVTGRVITENV